MVGVSFRLVSGSCTFYYIPRSKERYKPIVWPGSGWVLGMTNYCIGPHQTASDHIGSHQTASNYIGPCLTMSANQRS